ncbi:sensor histidine kinase [Clostridium sp. ATCC 25772]|uniref:sensor histidine kinase n=1 Tax=Clostridium sp. ATCC 25772 TaxID=1676991 RepID=UPI0007847BE8|nr:sensor histidine kinase [Clostridium sp. ATCC 25772]
MIIVLCILIFILMISYILECRKYKFQSKQIQYIANKIESIIKNETCELILVSTEDDSIKSIASSVNHLLDYSHENKMAYENSKISMMRMLSNISHDLKTPLTTLKGYVEMLRIRFNNDRMIIKVDLRINEILELINRFFSLVKLKSGDKTLDSVNINICEICRKNMFQFYDILSEKNFYVDINIPEKPIYISADEEALNRVLKNILDNAIKHGGDGKYIGISIDVYEKNVCITIEDHGKGILERYKENVFQRMYTLDDAKSKDYQGSGLGLTISKELVEHMKGKIELISIPHKKTLFNIILPKANINLRKK